MFSSYLFVRADASKDYSTVRSTQGVRQLLKFGGQVATVPAELISRLKQQGQVHIQRKIEKGQSILVAEGPLKGMSGIFVHQDGHKRSLILLEMLNRTLEISMPNHLIATSR
jgi:transcriptional antiterminator RfaH